METLPVFSVLLSFLEANVCLHLCIEWACPTGLSFMKKRHALSLTYNTSTLIRYADFSFKMVSLGIL